MSRPRPAAIFSPLLDFLCAGGFSIIVLVPLLVLAGAELEFVSLAALAWAQILINMSHFMASYRIVYRDKAMILRHKWATIGVPVILLLYILVAVDQAREGPPVLVGILIAVSSGYLAWHYTGQVWGMVASFSYLAGIKIEPVERTLIRASLRILLAWHVVWAIRIWFMNTRLDEPLWVAPLYMLVTMAVLAAFGLGAAGFLKIRARTGHWPPARALVAWLAIFVWYAAMARWGLAGLFLVQLAHALQYLAFPARVELNRAAHRPAGRVALHMALYGLGILLVSFVVTQFVPGPAMSSVAELVGDGQRSVVPVLILTFINIHHYFTDGVIWRLSNPEVRKELFSHLQPAAPAVTLPAPASTPKLSGKKKSKRGR
jgi:hypothetical protein